MKASLMNPLTTLLIILNYLDFVKLEGMSMHLPILHSLSQDVAKSLIFHQGKEKDILSNPEKCVSNFHSNIKLFKIKAVLTTSGCSIFKDNQIYKNIQLIYSINEDPKDFSICIFKLIPFIDYKDKIMFINLYALYENEWILTTKLVKKYEARRDMRWLNVNTKSEYTNVYDLCSHVVAHEMSHFDFCWNEISDNNIYTKLTNCGVSDYAKPGTVLLLQPVKNDGKRYKIMNKIDSMQIERHPCNKLRDDELCDVEPMMGNFYVIYYPCYESGSCELHADQVNIVIDRDLNNEYSYICEYKKNSTLYKHDNYVEITSNRKDNYEVQDLSKCFKSQECDGDVNFCRNFQCKKNDVKYKCLTDYNTKQQWLSMGNNQYVISQLKYVSAERPVLRGKNGLTIKDSCETCEFKCEKGIFSFKSHFNTIEKITLCKLPICLEFDVNDKEFTLALPRQTVMTDGNIKISYKLKDNDYELRKLLPCEKVEFCSYRFNFFHSENWIYPDCYTKLQWMIVGLMSIVILSTVYVLIVLMVKLLIILSKISWPVIKFVSRKLKFLLMKIISAIVSCHKGIKRDNDKSSSIDKSNLNSLEEGRIGESENKFGKKKAIRSIFKGLNKSKSNNNKSMLFTIICILNLFLTGGLCCDSISQIIIDQRNCLNQGSDEINCQFQSASRLSLSSVGGTSCFSINMKGSDHLDGSLQIRTESIQLSCDESILYYIPDFELKCQSAFNCVGAGWCSIDYRECNNPEKYISSIFSRSKTATSIAGCSQKPSAGGCFYSSASCLHHLAWLQTKGKNVIKVSECINWKYRVRVTISELRSGNQASESLILSPGVPVNWRSYKLDIISISLPPSIVFNRCFINRGRQWALTECNRFSELSTLRVGSVQCPTIDDAKDPDLKNCIMSPDMIKITEKNQFINCGLNSIDIDNVFKYSSLPLNHGDNKVVIGELGPEIIVSKQSLLEIQLESNNYQIQKLMDKSSCVTHFLKLDGCYNCPQGSIASFKIKTDFGSALANIKCQNNLTFPISVNNEERIQNITLHFSQKDIDLKCDVICPNSINKINIKGQLLYSPQSSSLVNHTISGIENNMYGINMQGFFSALGLDFNLFNFNYFKLYIIAAIVGIIIIMRK